MFCSSLFRDSDGDVASEFYVEVMSSQGHATKKRWTFRKVTSNLQPVVSVSIYTCSECLYIPVVSVSIYTCSECLYIYL